MRDAEISAGVCRILGLGGLYPQHIPLTKTFIFSQLKKKLFGSWKNHMSAHLGDNF